MKIKFGIIVLGILMVCHAQDAMGNETKINNDAFNSSSKGYQIIQKIGSKKLEILIEALVYINGNNDDNFINNFQSKIGIINGIKDTNKIYDFLKNIFDQCASGKQWEYTKKNNGKNYLISCIQTTASVFSGAIEQEDPNIWKQQGNSSKPKNLIDKLRILRKCALKLEENNSAKSPSTTTLPLLSTANATTKNSKTNGNSALMNSSSSSSTSSSSAAASPSVAPMSSSSASMNSSKSDVSSVEEESEADEDDQEQTEEESEADEDDQEQTVTLQSQSDESAPLLSLLNSPFGTAEESNYKFDDKGIEDSYKQAEKLFGFEAEERYKGQEDIEKLKSNLISIDKNILKALGYDEQQKILAFKNLFMAIFNKTSGKDINNMHSDSTVDLLRPLFRVIFTEDIMSDKEIENVCNEWYCREESFVLVINKIHKMVNGKQKTSEVPSNRSWSDLTKAGVVGIGIAGLSVCVMYKLNKAGYLPLWLSPKVTKMEMWCRSWYENAVALLNVKKFSFKRTSVA